MVLAIVAIITLIWWICSEIAITKSGIEPKTGHGMDNFFYKDKKK